MTHVKKKHMTSLTGTRTQDLSQTGRILLPLSHQTNGRPSILQYTRQGLGNSYTMGCPPVHGDNPRALASGLSYVQVDKHAITILYQLHQCRPRTSRDILCKRW